MTTRVFASLLLLLLALGVVGPTTGLATDAPPRTITIEPQGNQLAFATKAFTVQAGETVRLVFKNTATSPAMQHNVVLLNTMDDAAATRVGQAALSAADFVPDDPAVMAATPVAKPGETVSVTFTAPEAPGKYRFLCTFPGHYVSMQGTMTVK
ncbi:plastocyanin/azurin family copper-binding protein [Salisaeta longa]|uniref:plastocyanin/azurin family copper-binding protein n=1 Tax=Salisaeta longa TaxID=503170 RepID=UPI0004902422|nr:plastocyanin/azurin family copper-binding protein [Salisaeta longa]